MLFAGMSCNKKRGDELPINPGVPRKVQFILYTDKNDSSDNHLVVFKPTIENAAHQVLWDSALAPIAIKNIPDPDHKLFIEKEVPGNDPSLLKVGFYYSIEGVGNSWHLDSFNVGQTLKILEFNFQ